MPSVREQVVQALCALWGAEATERPGGLTVHRNPALPLNQDHLPAVAVYLAPRPGSGEAETAERLDHSPGLERTLRVRAEIRTGKDNVEQLHAQTDDVYVWLVMQVREDPTLGGLVEDVQEVATRFEAAESDLTYHALGVEFDIYYATSETDPRLPPPEEE